MHENIKEKVDTVIYCNSIHYVEEKKKFFIILEIDLERGQIAFNTSFFDGSHPKETEAFLRKWMLKSLRLLRSEYNLKPVKNKVQSRIQLSPEKYEDSF